MLLFLAIVNEARDSDMRARLIQLRIHIIALLLPLLLSVLKSGKDCLVGHLIGLRLHGHLRTNCLLKTPKIDLIEQLDHGVELRLRLLDLVNVDA